MIYALILGGIAGWLAGQIMKGEGFGLLWNIIIGSIGGWVGHFVFGLLGFATTGMIGSLITAVVGAIILVWVVNKIKS